MNAKIGSKASEFLDLHHDVIISPDQYLNLYMRSFKDALSPEDALYPNAHRENFEEFKRSKAAQEYLALFLKRSYLKHYTELSRKRPLLAESEIWIGQNRADYGILISPRYNKQSQDWENDKSEIRKFPKLYWTIGHVLETGLVAPGDPDKLTFKDINSYLAFFKNSLVRASGSPHEKRIADLYVDFVRSAHDPEGVPLLIPEYRFEGKAAQHRYRLDFCIINPYTMTKVGYELSPWSTHGYLKNLKGLTQKKINELAQDNFEKEMKKHKSFFKRHDIYALIYTDSDLSQIDKVFDDMKKYLEPVDEVVQLDFDLMNNFFK